MVEKAKKPVTKAAPKVAPKPGSKPTNAPVKKAGAAAPVKKAGAAPAKKAPEKKIEKKMEEMKIEEPAKPTHFTKLDEMIKEHGHEDIQKCFEQFLQTQEFGDPPEEFNENLEGREFKEWMHFHNDDAMSDDEFDYDWYQGDVNAEGKPDGRGVFLKLTIPELTISYFKDGARHGKYTMIRYDGHLFQGTYLQGIGEHGFTMVTLPNGSQKKQVYKGNEKTGEFWMKENDGESTKPKTIGGGLM